jgi:sugar/nucleoside kinase (ribokinase family)
VAGEVDAGLVACFPGALLGIGAQGWLRETAPDTSVQPVLPDRWDARAVLSHANALFVSDEDVPPQAAAAALKRWGEMVATVAFTRGYNGADILHNGAWSHIDAFPAAAVDPTGAGDVFAAAFLVRLRETGDVREAARFAACAASSAVEGEGTSAIPGRPQIEERLRLNPDIIAR